MTIIKYLQLPFLFDAKHMQEEVYAITSGKWLPHYQKLHYEGEWSALPLRSVGGSADSILVSPTADAVYEDTLFLQQSPYLQSVLQQFKCPLQAVRLLKLDAGAIIKEHRDAELNYERGEIRIHIPVITHPDVEFYLDNERLTMQEGECWYMNVNLQHRISNLSNINRIHLVIDALVNDWVKEVFSSPSVAVRKDVEDTSGIYDEATRKKMIELFREMNTDISNRMADELENHPA